MIPPAPEINHKDSILLKKKHSILLKTMTCEKHWEWPQRERDGTNLQEALDPPRLRGRTSFLLPLRGRVVFAVLRVYPSWENNPVISNRKMIYWGQLLFTIGQESQPCSSMVLISSVKPFNDEVVAFTWALNWITGTSLMPSVTLSGNAQR